MPASRSRANAPRRTPPPPADSAPGGEVPNNVLKAATDGRLGAVRSWLNEGGKADTLAERPSEVSGLPIPCTLLMLAAQHGHVQIVGLLLKRGADINLQTSRGNTALNAAANGGRERMVDLLLQHGAELNPQDSAAWSALSTAAKGGKERVVDLLLRRGAEIDLQYKNGDTASKSAPPRWTTTLATSMPLSTVFTSTSSPMSWEVSGARILVVYPETISTMLISRLLPPRPSSPRAARLAPYAPPSRAISPPHLSHLRPSPPQGELRRNHAILQGAHFCFCARRDSIC